MEKQDLIQMILDNLVVFKLALPPHIESNSALRDYLKKLDENALNSIASFNKILLKYFLDFAEKKNPDELKETLQKMSKISEMISPMGNLGYLGADQINKILQDLNNLKLSEITEEKISVMADKQLEQEIGGNLYNNSRTLENQISSARYYLSNIGYRKNEIDQKIEQAKENPSKIDELFSLPPKEIYNVPPELDSNQSRSSSAVSSPGNESPSEDISQDIISQRIQAIHQDISDERSQKVEEILNDIKDYAKDKMNQNYEKAFSQMHPDRLRKAYKMLKDAKRKSERFDLLLDWFMSSLLLSKIELKVEHWQVSSSTSHGNAGVYTAGMDFSRYDNIIRDFSDSKLKKVVNISMRILKNPTKKKIQKLGQDLIAETGFDEHLYFTD
jgi:hypothetical protein